MSVVGKDADRQSSSTPVVNRGLPPAEKSPARPSRGAVRTTIVDVPADRPALRPSRPGLPLEARLGQPEPLSERRQKQLLWTLIALGVLARVVRYLLRFPLWADETALAANLLDRGYLDLAQPLGHEQVCPVGFLWTQLTLVRWFGFSEYTLRLPAMLCSVASVFLFQRLAKRLLSGSALVLAVGVFAVAYPGIRYAAEAKPYACDLFFATLLLTVAVEWWRGNRDNRWLWLLAALMPLALLFSYPVLFVAGGISLAVAWVLFVGAISNRALNERNSPLQTTPSRRSGWTAWLAFNASVLVSAGAVYLLFMGAQSASELNTMRVYWQAAFPPWSEPLPLLRWLFETHAGELLAYPAGGAHGGSLATLIFCAVAVALLWRRRQGTLLLLCLTPLGLTFVAAAIKRYPYGEVVRFQLYMAPIFCLLAGLGLSVLMAWCPRLRRSPSPPLLAAVALMAFAVGSIGRDFVRPAKGATDVQHRDLARQLWSDADGAGETVCLRGDLGVCFSPDSYLRRASSMYLCNQRIYLRRHALGEPPDWDRISAERPLRCVEFVMPHEPYDAAARDRWLQSMQARYRLIDRQRHPLGQDYRQPDAQVAEAYVEVYIFVPIGGY